MIAFWSFDATAEDNDDKCVFFNIEDLLTARVYYTRFHNPDNMFVKFHDDWAFMS